MSRYPQNTYVGMRYVPLFDGDWNNAKDYEPLTVVSLEGNSYTSKTFVPAGVSPVGNPDYWAETGNYNAQIEAYRQEVLQYNDRIQANADAIAALDEKEDADVELLKKKDPWGGIVICIGDSYLEGFTPNGNVTSWGQYIASKKNLSSDRYVAKYKGGVGFSTTVDNVNFSTLLADAINSVDASKVSLIIIAGGYNDGSKDTSASIINIVTSAKTKCPDARVYVGYCGYGAIDQSPYQKAAGYRYPQYAISAGGYSLGNLSDILKANNDKAMDGYHPNANGEELLASNIISIIDSGIRYEFTIPHATAIFSGDTTLNNCFLSINNGELNIESFSDTSLEVNITANVHNLKVASITFNNPNINFHGSLFMSYQMGCYVKSGGKYYNGVVILQSSNTPNTIDILVTCLNEARNGYLGSVEVVGIYPFKANAPLGFL